MTPMERAVLLMEIKRLRRFELAYLRTAGTPRAVMDNCLKVVIEEEENDSLN